MNTIEFTTSSELVSINPATSLPVGNVPITSVDSIPKIVEKSLIAQKNWAEKTIEERKEILIPAANELEIQSKSMAKLLTQEMGKPLAESLGEITYAAKNWIHELDEIQNALKPQTIEDDSRTTNLYYDPLGVSAVITPWNFPLLMPHKSLLPSLVAGNSVILKPSEETPLIAHAYCNLLQKFLPQNVLQIIHGDEIQGKKLVASNINLVVFTGSKAAGEHILESSSNGLKRVILELGGKDPMIVLSDSNIQKAVEFGVHNAFRNAGQVCVSTERIYVNDSIADEFENLFIKKTSELIQGNGLDENVSIGPMINCTQKNIVENQVNDAIGGGAKLLYQGGSSEGNYSPVTVLTNLHHGMKIMNEETFGPVACIQRVSSDEEAITLANDTPYGLGACVFGEIEHARSVARKLGAGMIGINSGCGGATGSPWVGSKGSGYGFHSGPMGHRQFCQIRTVSIPKT